MLQNPQNWPQVWGMLVHDFRVFSWWCTTCIEVMGISHLIPVITETEQSRMRGIFIGDTTYFIVILILMKYDLSFSESQCNMSYVSCMKMPRVLDCAISVLLKGQPWKIQDWTVLDYNPYQNVVVAIFNKLLESVDACGDSACKSCPSVC